METLDYQANRNKFPYILRESITRGYPFFYVKKGHKYVFYSVLSKHLSSYN